MTDSPRLAQVFKATSRGGNRQPPNKGIPIFFSPKKFGVFCVFFGILPRACQKHPVDVFFFFRHFPKVHHHLFLGASFPKKNPPPKAPYLRRRPTWRWMLLPCVSLTTNGLGGFLRRAWDDRMGMPKLPGGAWYDFLRLSKLNLQFNVELPNISPVCFGVKGCVPAECIRKQLELLG